ncbi:MAG: heme-binding protein [Caldimonas sp.]
MMCSVMRVIASASACAALLGLSSSHAAAAPAEPAIVRVQSIGLGIALAAAQSALAACRGKGALVAVAVTDRSGVVLAVLRDPLAGMHTAEAATRKAWTAVSFRNSTAVLERATAPATESAGIRQLPGVAMVGGGLPIEAAGKQIGGIGVSGAPSGVMDEACARAGLASIRDDLELSE